MHPENLAVEAETGTFVLEDGSVIDAEQVLAIQDQKLQTIREEAGDVLPGMGKHEILDGRVIPFAKDAVVLYDPERDGVFRSDKSRQLAVRAEDML